MLHVTLQSASCGIEVMSSTAALLRLHLYYNMLLTTAGVECDISIGSSNAVFKSTVLGYLTSIDSRFSPLVRLVKLWAKAKGLNDPSRGTFNSYTLTLVVSMAHLALANLTIFEQD